MDAWARTRIRAVGDEAADLVGNQAVVRAELGLEDGQAGLDVRGLDVGHEAALEAAAKPVLQGGDVLGGPVTADDDLLLDLVEGVEGVEELLLGPIFAGQELDVVDEQDVDGAVPVAEVVGLVLLDGRDHLVGEFLRGDVGDLGRTPVALAHGMADGVHEMGLAQTHAAVEEERVVGLARGVGHRAAGGVSEA
jgi:hypothetical protein